jgi:cytochrome c
MNLEFNKLAAAILIAGLVAMVAGTIAKILYQPEEIEKRGYKIEGVETASTSETKQAINIPKLLAAGNAESGANIAKKCMTCHSFEKGGEAKVGPNLWGVLGGKTAHVAGFAYSKGLAEKNSTWTYEEIWEFLNNPAKYIKGTKMSFAGLKKPEELADVIAYLRKMHDNPPALPEVKETEEKTEKK